MAGVWRLLLATPDAVPVARHALDELTEVDEDTRCVVELLTSELVTNAVRHGASDQHESILVSAHQRDGTVRVEVCDEGDGFAQRGDPGDLMEPGGHGLLLVDALSSRWGAIPGEPSCVWFEAG
jgi:anti-sigma regulatory factor (Ser/Thr protein kinase)